MPRGKLTTGGLLAVLQAASAELKRDDADAHLVIANLRTALDVAEQARTASGNGPCRVCGAPDVGPGGTYWFAPNELWNEVNGSPNGLLCPGCFTAECGKKGIVIGWRSDRVGDVEDD